MFGGAVPRLQNNQMIFNLIYMYSHGNWMIMPYYQYTDVKANPSIGILEGGHTNGGAVLANYNFKHGVSLAVRPEYIKSNGSVATGEANLLYGPGSGGFSFTVTPTYARTASSFEQISRSFISPTLHHHGAWFWPRRDEGQSTTRRHRGRLHVLRRSRRKDGSHSGGHRRFQPGSGEWAERRQALFKECRAVKLHSALRRAAI